jgi:hypothetical protein
MIAHGVIGFLTHNHMGWEQKSKENQIAVTLTVTKLHAMDPPVQERVGRDRTRAAGGYVGFSRDVNYVVVI